MQPSQRQGQEEEVGTAPCFLPLVFFFVPVFFLLRLIGGEDVGEGGQVPDVLAPSRREQGGLLVGVGGVFPLKEVYALGGPAREIAAVVAGGLGFGLVLAKPWPLVGVGGRDAGAGGLQRGAREGDVLVRRAARVFMWAGRRLREELREGGEVGSSMVVRV